MRRINPAASRQRFRRALALSRFRAAGDVCPASRRSRKTRNFGTLFHVKQEPPGKDFKFNSDGFRLFSFFLRSGSVQMREDRSMVPAFRTRDLFHARLNHRRKASTTASVRQTLSAHVSAARAETARGWRHVPLVMSESAEARGDRPIYRLNDRASLPSQRSAPI